MANTFVRKTSRAVGVAAVQVGAYAVAASTQATVIGLTVANILGSVVKASVYHYDGTNITYLVKNMDVVPGQSQVVVGGDQKMVLQTGDSIYVISDTAASLDVLMSVLELT